MDKFNEVFRYLSEAPRNRKSRQDEYGFERASRAKNHALLAGLTIHVVQMPNQRIVVEKFPMKFTEAFVDFVSGEIELGLAPDRPGVILVAQTLRKPDASIVACYTDLTWPVLLWRESEFPQWMRKADEQDLHSALVGHEERGDAQPSGEG